MLWALFPHAMFMPKERSVHALIKFHSRTLHSEVSALVDSGAMENFITPDVVKHFYIPTYKLPTSGKTSFTNLPRVDILGFIWSQYGWIVRVGH